MQSCCRVARRALSRRSLATSASPQASTSTSAASTSSGAVAYSRPIPEGKLPAYDEAVAFIEQDKQERLKAIEEAKKQLQSLSADAKAGERIVLYNTIQANEIASLINDSETRWKFRNGQADMSKPVFRYLAEQAWRENGDLGLLMQRVSQMGIVPDLLGMLAPQADVRICLNGGYVEPGSFVPALANASQAPEIKVQVYHPEERLYTLLMLDPDVPDVVNDSFTTKCHLAIVDIPLTASTDLITEASGRTLVSWTPPNPGSIRLPKYHRYTYLLYRQRTELPDDVTITEQQKVNFDTRAFTDEQALKAVGVTFFRLAPNGAA